MSIKVRLYRTENAYYNQKIADFLTDFDLQHDKDIAAMTLSFIMNNYPETQLFLRGEKVGETSKEIQGV